METQDFLLIITSLTSLISAQFDSRNCGKKKGCLFSPIGCSSELNCQISFSYLLNGDYLDMEIFGPLISGYIAVGFSDDRLMGDDTVAFCANTAGRVRIGLSRNTNNRENIILNNSDIQIVNYAVSENGNSYCNFSQLLNTRISDVRKLDRTYHILMASGPMNARGLAYHQNSRFILPQTNLTIYKRNADGLITINNRGPPILQTNYPSRSNSDKLKIAHGILMVLSWIVFLAIGIIFARYFKRFCSDTRICGTDIWFHVHRTLNMVGIVGSVCGFVMIFVANDWRWKGPTAFQSAELNQQWSSVHSMLGLISCVMAWVQPLNAVFRCKTHQKGRLIFNWIHRFLGLGAWLCGASAIMIACVHFNLMFNNHDAAFGLFLVFLSVSGFTLIAMEFINIKTWWLRRSGTSSELEVTQIEKPYILVVLLIFFVVVAIGCAIAICTLIALKPID